MIIELENGREYPGSWWHPADPSAVLSGLLTIDDEGLLSLRVLVPEEDGALAPEVLLDFERLNAVLGPDSHPEVVHGLIEATEITLWRLLITQSPSRALVEPGTPSGAGLASYHVHRALLGGHVGPLSDFKAQSVRIGSSSLLEFLRGSIRTDVGTVGSIHASTAVGFDKRIVLHDPTLYLRAHRRHDFKSTDQSGHTSIETYAEFRFGSPRRLETDIWTDALRPMQWLLAFACQRPAHLNSMMVRLLPTQEWLPIYGSGIGPRPELGARSRPLFRLVDLPTPTRPLQSWWAVCRTMTHGVANYVALFDTGIINMPHRIFLTASAIEAIGTGVHAGLAALSPEDLVIYGSILRSLDKKQRGWLKNKTQHLNSPSYRSVAEALAALLPPGLHPLLADRPQWSKALVAARNDLAHALEKYTEYAEDIEYQYTLADVTKMVLSNALLQQIGIGHLSQRLVDRHGHFADRWSRAAKARNSKVR